MLSDVLAKSFIKEFELSDYSPYALHGIWKFQAFLNAVSNSEVTDVAIYTEKNKPPQIYKVKELLKKIDESSHD